MLGRRSAGRRRGRAAGTALVAVLATGCSTPGSTPGPLTTTTEPATTPGGPAPTAARDAPDVSVPAGFDGSTPLPVLILLHGYTSDSGEVDEYFGLSRVAADNGLLYVRPNGTRDVRGDRFWNATDACCDLWGSGVDDSGYLTGLLDDLADRYPVDPRRVYLMGHSNGAFMAHRMACDHADRVAAIVAVAGVPPSAAADCTPSAPVSVLQVHGTDDDRIRYDGGETLARPYPGARAAATQWARRDDCADGPVPGPALDLVDRADIRSGEHLDGAETGQLRYGDCAEGTVVQVWTIRGGGHAPEFTTDFAAAAVGFLLAHPKPR